MIRDGIVKLSDGSSDMVQKKGDCADRSRGGSRGGRTDRRTGASSQCPSTGGAGVHSSAQGGEKTLGIRENRAISSPHASSATKMEASFLSCASNPTNASQMASFGSASPAAADQIAGGRLGEEEWRLDANPTVLVLGAGLEAITPIRGSPEVLACSLPMKTFDALPRVLLPKP